MAYTCDLHVLPNLHVVAKLASPPHPRIDARRWFSPSVPPARGASCLRTVGIVREAQKAFSVRERRRSNGHFAIAAARFRRGRGAPVCALKAAEEPLMELSEGQSCIFHELPSGLRMEVIVQSKAREDESKPPLVFVHGSYHAAWCWACWWLPYFSSRGHDCYAVSLIGQGASDVPVEKVSLSLQSHAEDVAHFIRHKLSAPPVLIGHSFGGLVVQWFLSTTTSTSNPSTGRGDGFPSLQAAALICSTPPTGNGYFSAAAALVHDLGAWCNTQEWPMVQRFIKRDLIASIQITLSLAAKLFGVSLSLCRKSFFSPGLPEDDLRKYQSLLKRSSRYPMLDLRKLNDSLPIPRPPPEAPPVFVLAAENDFVVDREGSLETAEWYGTAPQFIQGSGHDVMLDIAWDKGAAALYSCLEQHAQSQAMQGKYSERSAV